MFLLMDDGVFGVLWDHFDRRGVFYALLREFDVDGGWDVLQEGLDRFLQTKSQTSMDYVVLI